MRSSSGIGTLTICLPSPVGTAGCLSIPCGRQNRDGEIQEWARHGKSPRRLQPRLFDFLVLLKVFVFRGQKANYALPPLERKTVVEQSYLLDYFFLSEGCGAGGKILGVREPLMRSKMSRTEDSSTDVAFHSRHLKTLQACALW